MTGKFKSLWDYVMNFLQAIARAVANYMSQSIVQSIIPSIFPSAALPGGTTMAGGYPVAHAGGLVMHGGGYVPRFHIGGLSSDEVPAILQKGEYVVSRKGVAALDRINKGQAGGVSFVMNVENNTGQPIEAKNTGMQFNGERFVVSVVLNNIEQGGPIRNAITGLRR